MNKVVAIYTTPPEYLRKLKVERTIPEKLQNIKYNLYKAAYYQEASIFILNKIIQEKKETLERVEKNLDRSLKRRNIKKINKIEQNNDSIIEKIIKFIFFLLFFKFLNTKKEQ